MNILGISCFYHDSASALEKNLFAIYKVICYINYPFIYEHLVLPKGSYASAKKG